MDIHQRYRLAASVVLVEADKIEAANQQHLDLTGTDLVLTYTHSRKRSKLVSAELAALLRLFETPQTIAEAIFKYAQDTQQDAQQVADVVFQQLLQLQEEGYLMPDVSSEKKPRSHQLSSGDVFMQYEIKSVVQGYENCAVYQLADKSGKRFALKLFSPAFSQPPEDYTNEVTILQKLDNTVNPVIVEFGEHHSSYYLITEWCEGTPCEEAAKNYRNFISRENVKALLRFCTKILQAYQHLHAQGVLHGDVHPANVLINQNGDVCLIDYGNAEVAGRLQKKNRGAVDFYYEPELAAALLQGKEAVPITEKSEQYAVAILLYHLITGHHYLHFSYEPTKAYQQIVNDPPLPFSDFDIDLPPFIDAIFQKALAKKPEHRFDSLAAFAAALQQCISAVEENRLFLIGEHHHQPETFVRMFLRKYGSSHTLIQRGLQLPPACSVNYGAAGIAYFLYRAACVLEEPALLDTADVWVHHALAYEDDFDKGFYSADEGITQATVGRRALYHSPSGVHLVQAMISTCRGNGLALESAVQHYLKTAAVPCQQIDLALGKAGLLLGSALLLKELNTVEWIDTSPLLSFTHRLMEELWQTLQSCPSMATEKTVGYFGIAHGWAGMLYATLLWCQASGQALPEGFSERLEELLTHALPDNGGLQWPVSGDNKRSWLGWCHGNAGYVFLWVLAYHYFNEERFRILAVQTGKALFNSRPQTSNLCCGLAGEAYALLKLFQLTGEKQYNQQVEKLKSRMLRSLSSPDLRNHSLYKGEIGIGVLLCELTRPEMARMPLFE